MCAASQLLSGPCSCCHPEWPQKGWQFKPGNCWLYIFSGSFAKVWPHPLPRPEVGESFFLFIFQNGWNPIFLTSKWPHHSVLSFPTWWCGEIQVSETLFCYVTSCDTLWYTWMFLCVWGLKGIRTLNCTVVFKSGGLCFFPREILPFTPILCPWHLLEICLRVRLW